MGALLKQLGDFLREFGFPALVALWFMFRLERRIDRTNTLLSNLLLATDLLSRSVDSSHETTRRLRAITGEVPALPEASEKKEDHQ